MRSNDYYLPLSVCFTGVRLYTRVGTHVPGGEYSPKGWVLISQGWYSLYLGWLLTPDIRATWDTMGYCRQAGGAHTTGRARLIRTRLIRSST